MEAKPTGMVLHIAPTPFFSNRGCHIRIKNIVDALSTAGFSSLVCTYHLGDTPAGIEVKRTLPIKPYTQRGAGFSPYKFPADLLLLFLAIKTVWQYKPVLVYGHLHEGALIGWLLKTLFFWRKIDLVMDMQGSLSGELAAYGTFQSRSWKLGIFRWVEGLVYSLPRRITCSSAASQRCLIEDFSCEEELAILLPDVVGEDFFSDREDLGLMESLGLSAAEKVVVYSGSLLPGKGIDALYQAIALICKERQDCRFLLIGYPIEQAEKFVSDNALQNRCILTGEVNYKDLAAYLAVADIAVDPKAQSSGEASGKILHYMAASLPVVCFDLPNNRALLKESGNYADSVTVEGLALAINAALDQHNIAEIGQQLKKTLKQSYSIKASGELLAAKVLIRPVGS